MSDRTPPGTPTGTPPTLLLAALLVGLQGVGFLALCVVGLLDVQTSRVEVGLSVAVFFGVCAAALLACAWALTRVQGWARGPVLLTQLLQLGIAWNVRETALLAVPLALTALVALVAMLHPRSIAALLGEPSEDAS